MPFYFLPTKMPYPIVLSDPALSQTGPWGVAARQ